MHKPGGRGKQNTHRCRLGLSNYTDNHMMRGFGASLGNDLWATDGTFFYYLKRWFWKQSGGDWWITAHLGAHATDILLLDICHQSPSRSDPDFPSGSSLLLCHIKFFFFLLLLYFLFLLPFLCLIFSLSSIRSSVLFFLSSVLPVSCTPSFHVLSLSLTCLFPSHFLLFFNLHTLYFCHLFFPLILDFLIFSPQSFLLSFSSTSDQRMSRAVTTQSLQQCASFLMNI